MEQSVFFYLLYFVAGFTASFVIRKLEISIRTLSSRAFTNRRDIALYYASLFFWPILLPLQVLRWHRVRYPKGECHDARK